MGKEVRFVIQIQAPRVSENQRIQTDRKNEDGLLKKARKTPRTIKNRFFRSYDPSLLLVNIRVRKARANFRTKKMALLDAQNVMKIPAQSPQPRKVLMSQEKHNGRPGASWSLCIAEGHIDTREKERNAQALF